MSCTKCNKLDVRIRLPKDLSLAIELLAKYLDSGIIFSIGFGRNSASFSGILGYWSDIIDCYFECSECKQKFQLKAETYRGGGGWLRAIDKVDEAIQPESDDLESNIKRYIERKNTPPAKPDNSKTGQIKRFFNQGVNSTKILQILNWDDTCFSINDVETWDFKVIDSPVLSESFDGYFLLPGTEITSTGNFVYSIIDLTMPERISESTFKFDGKQVHVTSQLENDSEFMPSIVTEGYGNYELYYSKIAPEVSIRFLKLMIVKTKNESSVAEDLGYILRDENQYEEAIKYFHISADSKPSSDYIYAELASLYREIGDSENEKKYAYKANTNSVIYSCSPNEKKPWWKFWNRSRC